MKVLERISRALLFIILIAGCPVLVPIAGIIWIFSGSAIYMKAMNWCVIGEYHY